VVEPGREPFLDRLQARSASLGGSLCVGLDPILDSLPHHLGSDPEGARRYCLELVEAVAEHVCAFKPNAAFFEAMGPAGWELLREVVLVARGRALVVLDAKRGDIGHTAQAYASAAFEQLGADACTVNGYLGYDAVEPFLRRADRMAFVLCRTSNASAGDLQDLVVGPSGSPLYLEVARRVAGWCATDPSPRLGLVTGATWPREIGQIREAAPRLPFLIPGVGAQGGDLEQSVAAARGPDGSGPYLLTVSRAIGGASRGRDFAAAASIAAAEYLARIQSVTATEPAGQGASSASTL
jgi:orotidine-5'-phosphate decarboxylase